MFLPSSVLLRIYKQTVLPILDYGSTVWHECGITQTKRVEKLQNRAMRIILHQGRRKCTQDMRDELKLLTLCSRRRFLRFICIFRLVNNMDCPIQLKDTFKFRFNVHFVTNESDNKLILFERRFDVIFTSFSSSFKVRYD